MAAGVSVGAGASVGAGSSVGVGSVAETVVSSGTGVAWVSAAAVGAGDAATSAKTDAPPEEASISRTSAMAVIRLPSFWVNFFMWVPSFL